jgi:hypothetical protein
MAFQASLDALFDGGDLDFAKTKAHNLLERLTASEISRERCLRSKSTFKCGIKA